LTLLDPRDVGVADGVVVLVDTPRAEDAVLEVDLAGGGDQPHGVDLTVHRLQSLREHMGCGVRVGDVQRGDAAVGLVVQLEEPLDFRRLASLGRSEEHTSELQSRENLVCRLLLEKKKTIYDNYNHTR